MAKFIRSTYKRLPIFYGDDGRRVKTVYVSNIRERVSENDSQMKVLVLFAWQKMIFFFKASVSSLENKYSIYGPVQSCTLNYHENSDERYAIVTMFYAYDASKILADYPDDVKHLYSLLPKPITTNFTRNSPHIVLPKKQTIRRMNRIEVALIEIQITECAQQPSVAVVSHIDEVVEEKKKLATPAPRRRRVVKSSKVKEQNVDKTLRVETKPKVIPTPENVTIEQLANDTPAQTHSVSTAAKCDEIETNPFTSLNDDCLISLFSFCDKLDLVSLAMVCERFRFIVFNYMKAKMSKIVDLGKIKSIDKLTICEATKFLKFIDAAQNTQQLELTLSSFHESKDELILNAILKCCGPTLNCIKFNGFSFTEAFTSQWKQLLHGLTTLIFHQCTLPTNHLSALLKICENLKVLDVTNSNSLSNRSDDHDIKSQVSEFKCKTLKEFRLTSSRNCGRSSELIWLLENNPNLNVLQISDVGDSIKMTGEILQCIGGFHELQDLAFSFQNFLCDIVTNLPHLIRLKELKSLSLHCDWMNISTFVRQFSQAANKQIERLSFECVDIDTSFMRSIGRFRKLKYLKLENTIVNEPSQEVFEQSLMDLTYRLNNLARFHCQLHLFTEDTLVQFVERMKRLEEFQISGLVMNLLLFMRIVTACGRRTNGIKLNIVIDNYQYLNEYLDLVSGKIQFSLLDFWKFSFDFKFPISDTK